jgi:hypothetical protein
MSRTGSTPVSAEDGSHESQRRAVRLELVRAAKRAIHPGDLDHGRASKLRHKPTEQTVQQRPSGHDEVGTDGGVGNADVTEQDLHDADRHSRSIVSRKGVPSNCRMRASQVHRNVLVSLVS